MKRILRNLIFMVCVIFFFSFSEEDKLVKVTPNEKLLKIKPKKGYEERFYKLSAVFESVRAVELELKGNKVIGDVTKVRFADDVMYIADLMYARSIFAYDMNGKCLRRYGRIGKGPGEYIGIRDFSINNGKLYLLYSFNKVNVYDLTTAEYINTITVEGGPFYYLESYKDYFVGDVRLDLGEIGKNSYACRSFDSNGKILGRYLDPIESNKGIKTLLTQGEGKSKVIKSRYGAYFINSYDNTVYKVEKNNITPFLLFDSKNFLKQGDFKYTYHGPFSNPKFKKGTEYGIRSFIETENLIYFRWKRVPSGSYLFYNKKKKKTILSGKGFYADLIIKNYKYQAAYPTFHYMDDRIAISTDMFNGYKSNIEKHNKQTGGLKFVRKGDKEKFTSYNPKVLIYKFKKDFR